MKNEKFQNWNQISETSSGLLLDVCFLQTRSSKTLNVSVDQKTRRGI